MEKITAKFSNVKVLIVDDYIINREVTEGMLELMECKVDAAEDGKEAVEKCKKSNYDIIFMDIQMPEMDGYEATQAIRDHEGDKKHTPIVALTANALTGDREKCLDAGMDDYISKPIKGDDLKKMIEAHVKQ